jgi:hypothetical protein
VNTQRNDVINQDEATAIESVTEQWIDQHTSLERYIFILYASFVILRRLKLDPHSWQWKLLILTFCLILYFGLPLISTTVMNQWSIAPVITWLAISILFGITFFSYDLYNAIGDDVCSIGRTVRDVKGMQRQIAWDYQWFNLRIAGSVGAVTALAVLLSFLYLRFQLGSIVIPVGTFIVFAFLSYHIGEIAYNNLLICFEAHNFSKMRHELFRFSPLDTFELQRAIRGYNRFGLMTSLVLTVYIASSALLLPNLAFLTNPIWLGLVLAVYIITILDVVVPRLYIQKIVRDFKKAQLVPLRNRIDFFFDRLDRLNDVEYAEMSRLVSVQEKIQNAPDSCFSFSTIGRIFGTLLLPTFTFILAVAGEVYHTKLIEGLFH